MIIYLTIFFSILAIICSLLIISVRNPIHSILYLILTFCNISFILLIWNVEFIAIIFLIVYVGAISVLFLFVVMMLNIKIIELNEIFWRYIPIGFLISLIFVIEIYSVIFKSGNCLFKYTFLDDINIFYQLKYLESFYNVNIQISSFLFFDNFIFWFNNLEMKHNTEILGWFLYTYNFYCFLVIGLILLLAMIGSIVLVLNQNINVKRQLIFKQTRRNLYNSIELKN